MQLCHPPCVGRVDVFRAAVAPYTCSIGSAPPAHPARLCVPLRPQPAITPLQSRAVWDALQMDNANCTAGYAGAPPPRCTLPEPAPRPVLQHADSSIYVDAAKGSDAAAGSESAPLKTVEAAVAKARKAAGEFHRVAWLELCDLAWSALAEHPYSRGLHLAHDLGQPCLRDLRCLFGRHTVDHRAACGHVLPQGDARAHRGGQRPDDRELPRRGQRAVLNISCPETSVH